MTQFKKHVLLALFAIFLPSQAYGFKAGFASRDITPNGEVTMGGYGVYVGFDRSVTRTNGEGVHDPILVQCVSMSQSHPKIVVLCSLDLIGLSRTLVNSIKTKIRQDLGNPSIQLVLSSTHNHQSPDTFGLWGALPFRSGKDKSYMDFIAKEIILAVKNSVANMQDASISYGASYLKNKKVGNFEDGKITILSFQSQVTGDLIGTLCQWSAHPTILGHKNNTISADFIGSYRKRMQLTYPGEHLYFNGTLGGVYAKDVSLSDDLYPEGDQDPHMQKDYQKASNLGLQLFQKVQAGLESTSPINQEKLDFKTKKILIPMKNWLFSTALRNKLIDGKLERGMVLTEVSWLQLGEIQVALFPGEVFPSLTFEARNWMKNNGAQETIIIGMANDWLGYLMTEEEFSSSDFSYQAMLSPSREAGEIILKGLKEIVTHFTF